MLWCLRLEINTWLVGARTLPQVLSYFVSAYFVKKVDLSRHGVQFILEFYSPLAGFNSYITRAGMVEGLDKTGYTNDYILYIGLTISILNGQKPAPSYFENSRDFVDKHDYRIIFYPIISADYTTRSAHAYYTFG